MYNLLRQATWTFDLLDRIASVLLRGLEWRLFLRFGSISRSSSKTFKLSAAVAARGMMDSRSRYFSDSTPDLSSTFASTHEPEDVISFRSHNGSMIIITIS